MQTLLGHTEPADSLLWYPTFRLLGSCSSDMTVRLWDPRTLKVASCIDLRRIKLPNNDIVPVLMDEKAYVQLGVGSALWDFDIRRSGGPLVVKEATRVRPMPSLHAVGDFSVGRGNVYGTENGEVVIIPPMEKAVTFLAPHSNLVTDICGDPMTRLVTCALDGSVMFRELGGRTISHRPVISPTGSTRTLINPPFPNCCVALSDNIILIGCGDGTVLTFFLEDVFAEEGGDTTDPECVVDAHAGSRVVSLLRGPGTVGMFTSGAHNGCVTLWRTEGLCDDATEAIGEVSSMKFGGIDGLARLNDMTFLGEEASALLAVATTERSNGISLLSL